MDVVKGDEVRSLPDYYSAQNRRVRTVFDAREREFEVEQPPVIGGVGQLHGRDRLAGADLMDEFTDQCVQKVVTAVEHLLAELHGAPAER